MNPPVIVWRRGEYRIVASDTDDTDLEPCLVMEVLDHDFMGAECWDPVSTDGVAQIALNLLKCEIASRNDLMPKWVKEFVAADLKCFDGECGHDHDEDEDEGA